MTTVEAREGVRVIVGYGCGYGEMPLHGKKGWWECERRQQRGQGPRLAHDVSTGLVVMDTQTIPSWGLVPGCGRGVSLPAAKGMMRVEEEVAQT